LLPLAGAAPGNAAPGIAPPGGTVAVGFCSTVVCESAMNTTPRKKYEISSSHYSTKIRRSQEMKRLHFILP
jgi:hypothetical protein